MTGKFSHPEKYAGMYKNPSIFLVMFYLLIFEKKIPFNIETIIIIIIIK